MQRDLGIKAGETTADGEFSLETVNCLGACALGPLVTIDSAYHGSMTVSRVDKVLQPFRTEAHSVEADL
jgi:NADH-quinone oxidoreductase subunit E